MDPDDSDLWLLGAAYFHQDWRLFDTDADGVVRRFIRQEGLESAAHAEVEIAMLLGRGPSEADLARLWTTDLKARWDPTRHGMTYRQWFDHVAHLLTSSAPPTA